MASTTTPNYHRVIIRLLREIAQERDIQLQTFSHDWIVRLEDRANTIRHIYGYNFDLNSAAAQAIATDKSAVSELLRHSQIPHVEHRLFLHPRLSGYISDHGLWTDMMAFAQQHKFKLVCKPNDGTGGEDVFQVRSQPELEQVVQRLFAVHRAICLSPFYNIDREYRVIILQGNCELIYAKKRPAISGDGTSTVADLIAGQVDAGAVSAGVAARAIKTHERRLDQILKKDERLPLDWKHNLAHGASPVIIHDQALQSRLGDLARTCAAELNIVFASIDIIETEGRYLVLEVNSGVMMEHFAELAPDGYAIAKGIYGKAIDLMFSGDV